jgi:hypothetical protein
MSERKIILQDKKKPIREFINLILNKKLPYDCSRNIINFLFIPLNIKMIEAKLNYSIIISLFRESTLLTDSDEFQYALDIYDDSNPQIQAIFCQFCGNYIDEYVSNNELYDGRCFCCCNEISFINHLRS